MVQDILVPIISRQEAISSGVKRYFSGEPCVKGHIAARSVGSNNECVECKALRDFTYASTRKLELAAYSKAYREKNTDRVKANKASYLQRNHGKVLSAAREDRLRNPQRYKEYREKYVVRRKAEIRAWRAKNKERVTQYKALYAQESKKKKSNYWLACVLRQRLAMAIYGGAKSGSAVSDLGCPIEHLKQHLAKHFQVGMTWENWGRNGWHIDHVQPLASFDLSDNEQLKIACHFTNLQPLWAVDNISKGARLKA